MWWVSHLSKSPSLNTLDRGPEGLQWPRLGAGLVNKRKLRNRESLTSSLGDTRHMNVMAYDRLTTGSCLSKGQRITVQPTSESPCIVHEKQENIQRKLHGSNTTIIYIKEG